MRRDHMVVVGLTMVSAVVLTLTIGVMARAQEASAAAPTPSPVCGLLTAKEIKAALGVKPVVADSSDERCTWGDVLSGALIVEYGPGTLAGQFPILQSGTPKDVQIAGLPGRTESEASGGYTYVQTDDHVLGLTWVGATPAHGVEPALTGLARLALPRLATMPAPATPSPRPSLGAYATPAPDASMDPVLAALFPSDLGGQPVSVEPYALSQALGFFDPGDPAGRAASDGVDEIAVQEGLGPEDVSTAGSVGLVDGHDVSVFALRLVDVDMSSLASELLPLTVTWMSDPQRATAQVAGRDVTVQTDGPDAHDAMRQYAYFANDVLWLVRASEPTLTEIIGKLPCSADQTCDAAAASPVASAGAEGPAPGASPGAVADPKTQFPARIAG